MFQVRVPRRAGGALALTTTAAMLLAACSAGPAASSLTPAAPAPPSAAASMAASPSLQAASGGAAGGGADGGGAYGGGGYGAEAGGTPAPAASAAAGAMGQAVKIIDFGFNPATITVKAGTTVTWTNTGSITHTVTANAGSFDSGHVGPSGTFSHTFGSAGTFAYHCAIHPSMTATVIVTP